MRKIILLITLSLLVLVFLTSSSSKNNYSISMNGILINLSDKVLNINDRIYVAEKDLSKIFRASYNNNILLNMDAKIIDHTNYYHVEMISQTLGYNVKWHESEKTLNIFKILTENEKIIVAHGGGHLEHFNNQITNTKNSLDNSYSKGIKLIELDIIWTTDLVPVISHDWSTLSNFANVPYLESGYSLNDFNNFDLWYDWEQLTFLELLYWLDDHPDVFIITDVKYNNLSLMRQIDIEYPMYKNRFIPQVFSEDEFYQVKELGFEPIIFTLYKSKDKNESVINLAKSYPNLIITMDGKRVESGLAQSLNDIGSYTYCHTINEFETRLEYMKLGVNGFYSDVFDVDVPNLDDIVKIKDSE